MALGEGPDRCPDRVSSLCLEPGGTFHAALKEKQHDADGASESVTLATASGSWRQCRGGMELVFAESAELGLEELLVPYALRRGCLVAEAADLPDGLAQEYSPCPEDARPASPLAAERLSLIGRMLADAAATAEISAPGAGYSGPEASSRSPTAVAAKPLLRPKKCFVRDGESDSDDCLEGTAPVGIIEDGSDSDVEGSTGGSTPRCEVQALNLSALPVQGVSRPPQNGKRPQVALAAAAEEEEYVDDFEGESDGGTSAEAK